VLATTFHVASSGASKYEATQRTVSNLSAMPPCAASPTTTTPYSTIAADLGGCGGWRGGAGSRDEAALASHGRGHRFETCHAHQAKRFPGPRFLGRLPEDLPEDHGLRVLEHSQRRPIRAARKPKIRSPALVPLRRAR